MTLAKVNFRHRTRFLLYDSKDIDMFFSVKVINRDSECGVRKGCFPTQNECSFDFYYLVKWRPVDNETIEFSLQRKGYGDKWIAIGFSDNHLIVGSHLTNNKRCCGRCTCV